MSRETADQHEQALFAANQRLAQTIHDLRHMNDQQRLHLDQLREHVDDQEALNACLTRRLARLQQATATAVIILEGCNLNTHKKG